jgi:very-short-patch-repair endonuclease
MGQDFPHWRMRSGARLPKQCSFCGLSEHQVKTLIAVPTKHICYECVGRCSEIVPERDGSRFGYDKLLHQIRLIIEKRSTGNSQIEKLLCESLVFGISLRLSDRFRDIKFAESEDSLTKGLAEQFSGDTNLLVVRQQAAIERWRVDFLIHYWSDGLNRFVVECDGHDFHERTKEQAANDRSRDRAMAMLGLTVLRFTGSEIWNDPMGCARQVIALAETRNRSSENGVAEQTASVSLAETF